MAVSLLVSCVNSSSFSSNKRRRKTLPQVLWYGKLYYIHGILFRAYSCHAVIPCSLEIFYCTGMEEQQFCPMIPPWFRTPRKTIFEWAWSSQPIREGYPGIVGKKASKILSIFAWKCCAKLLKIQIIIIIVHSKNMFLFSVYLLSCSINVRIVYFL